MTSTTHNLHLGGLRTMNPEWSMFPQTLPGLNDHTQVDNRRGPARFSNTRWLDFDSSSLVQATMVPAQVSPEATGSAGLRNYIKHNEIVAGDVIVTHVLPRFTSLDKVHWAVAKCITPFKFDIRVRGQAASVGAPIVLASNIDGGVVSSGLIDVVAVNGGKTVYFDQNDVLEIVIKDMPANDLAADGTIAAGINGLGLAITAVQEEFFRGAF